MSTLTFDVELDSDETADAIFANLMANALDTKPALRALLDFVAKLPENFRFQCSWESYAITQSTEEELLAAAVDEFTKQQEHADWLQILGDFTHELAAHARTVTEQRNAVRFCQSVLEVLVACHLTENDMMLSD